MLNFTYPWLFLLLIVPFMVVMAPKHTTQETALRFSLFQKYLDITGTQASKGALVLSPLRWQRCLVALTYLSLVIAATKPIWLGAPITIEKSGREMMVAIDLSGSMEATDFVTTEGDSVRRIDGVKLLLDDFLSQRQGDRIGLIAFGDDAYLQAPFTEDFSIIRQLLSEMDVRMAGAGTALGDAIGVAVNHFSQTQSENRVLLLLTDGRDTTSKFPPLDAAKFAGDHGITIYPIAIGDATNVGEDGIDLDMLNRIADYTDGQVFEALNGEDLATVYATLNQREAQLFDSYTLRPKTELFYWPLLLSLSLNLICLMFVIGQHRHKLRQGAQHG
ncbi:VWA domain-containing protein [Vibrio astriarenae]|uniref:VWA domain-containing protein n=1 Tax=Vibrio astriarenae TaxID=1481923 RepID=A0A7Z2YG13_9VIBR|nr:VWA domain-containing protein [Vibrio astriarenae]QIA66122.1 VWA domain-containing protein [Vibrio astriarenae]